MLNTQDQKILSIFAAAVRSRYPEARIWAFGSRTREDASSESNLDVCVVLDNLNDDKDREIINLAWNVGFEYGRIISTVTYSDEEFDNGPCSQSQLVKTVLNDGIPA